MGATTLAHLFCPLLLLDLEAASPKSSSQKELLWHLASLPEPLVFEEELPLIASSNSKRSILRSFEPTLRRPYTSSPFLQRQYGRKALPTGDPHPVSAKYLLLRNRGLSPEDQARAKQVAKDYLKGNPLLNKVAQNQKFSTVDLLARYCEGSKRSIVEANVLMRSMQKNAYFGTGVIDAGEKKYFSGLLYAKSALELAIKKIYPGRRKHELQGGYDFVGADLVQILWLYGRLGENLIDEKAHHHLLTNLLDLREDIAQLRATPLFSEEVCAPYALCFVEESENHVLMALSSIVLTYKYLVDIGDSSESTRKILAEMEQKSLVYMRYILTRGFHEFNSIPYVGYTIHPLQMLASYGNEEVARMAARLLDLLWSNYAFGTYKYHTFPPFCRQLSRVHGTSLLEAYQTNFIALWRGERDKVTQYKLGLKGLLSLYRPAQEIYDRIEQKNPPYLACIGHGPSGSPEIYYSKNRFLISGGGVKSSRSDERLATRPISLILDDGAVDIRELLRLGEYNECLSVNNSGVYERFACSAKPLILGSRHRVLASQNTEKGSWIVLEPLEELFVVAFSYAGNKKDSMGFFALFEGHEARNVMGIARGERIDPRLLLSRVVNSNLDPMLLRTTFIFPKGPDQGDVLEIRYDLKAPKDRYVIQSAQGIHELSSLGESSIDPNVQKWPMLRLFE